MEDVPLSPFYTKIWKIDAETAADSWGFMCINIVRLNFISNIDAHYWSLFNVNLNYSFAI